jgi:ketosteroid isomerase-like protein
MPEENAEIAKRAIKAFNERDVDAFAALTTADFEWSPSMVAVEGEIFRGREGIGKYFEHLIGAWEEFEVLPDRFPASADFVVMLGRLAGCGRGSGVRVESPLGMLFGFRNQTISQIRGYLDHGEALQAAGLSE